MCRLASSPAPLMKPQTAFHRQHPESRRCPPDEIPPSIQCIYTTSVLTVRCNALLISNHSVLLPLLGWPCGDQTVYEALLSQILMCEPLTSSPK